MHQLPTLPPLDGTVNHAPHIVLIGAGASIAADLHWGKEGKELLSMQGLIDSLSLREPIEEAGYIVEDLNFEAFYDDLASNGNNSDLQTLIEEKVYEYFSSLKLPDKPTIYDYLILGLREKDIIATFNWDPFLLQAYIRHEVVTKDRRPRIAFLHGNVLVGVCETDNIAGINGRICSRCNTPLSPSKLLYPVKHKDYTNDKFIKSEWDTLRNYINRAYFLTVFGYSAPVTDVEARNLMLEVWKNNKTLEFAEVEIIDIQNRDVIESNWKDFFFSHHYMVTDSVFKSYLFTHPRRSCDAFSAATLMCAPWHDNPFPNFETLGELQRWVKPLIEEEIEYDKNKTKFTGNPLLPNEKIKL